MHMTARRTALVIFVAAAMIAALFAFQSMAVAGHTNPVLEADLDGRDEVAADGSRALAGDPNGRGEIYVFGIDGDPARQTLCYVLLADKIADLDGAPGAPRMAHIHMGGPAENGPVVVSLAWPQDGQSADCFSVGDTRGGNPVFTGDITPADIFANPGAFYVNVHNGEYPTGAIRGQLASR